MKINIAFPATGRQKILEVEDEVKLRAFYDKRMSHEVDGEVLGDEWKGYIFRITGGNDLQGFPMKQGVLTNQRVKLLLKKGASCYRQRRKGERKRKSVRGCIVSAELSVLNLIIVQKGEKEVEGLTDSIKPVRLGPKRASRIRKLFNLTKEDDVRNYVVRRKIIKDGKVVNSKAPKIQRLITPQRLQRKRKEAQVKRRRYIKSRAEAREYNKLLAQRMKEANNQRQQRLAKRRSQSRRESTKETN